MSRCSKRDGSGGGMAGIGFGCCLAMAISFHVHESILWAIVHGVLSWIYVIYYAVTRQ